MMWEVTRQEEAEPIAYSIREAAEKLRIGEDFLRDLIRQERVPHVRLGKRIILPREQLLEWLKGQTVPVRT